MTSLPRGIAPDLLLSQVRNTMPYLFDEEVAHTPLGDFIPAQILRNFAVASHSLLSHFEYFRLCVSCHYLTCATPVPTDVDIQIRKKLWPKNLPLEVALQMSDFVLQSRHWNYTLVSRRFAGGAIETPWQKQVISGHIGEWFTIAAGAYCALSHYKSPLAQQKRSELFSEISNEIERHSEIFGTLWRAQDALACLKTSTIIAHNFGDLDRVMDMWDLPVTDPLRTQFYRLTTLAFDSDRNLRYLGRIWVAGQLYKSMIHGFSMSFENHRHFALRKPKCLRKHPDLMIQISPFLDEWGSQVAHFLANPDGTPSTDTLQVLEALKDGWDRLPKTVGYGRALHGILNVHPDLKIEGLTKQQKVLIEKSQERFEMDWIEGALHELDELPSRA